MEDNSTKNNSSMKKNIKIFLAIVILIGIGVGFGLSLNFANVILYNVCPNYLGKLKALVISAISSWLMPSGSNPMHFESI